jgi:GT2 family glycosyltransferase
MKKAPQSQPDISFVIISYNDAHRLPKALSSASLMSARAGFEYEIWVVDNGSSDHTQKLLASYGELLGPRLKTITLQSNTGTTYSRNQALRQASGRLICVLDSDAELLMDGLRHIDDLLTSLPEVGIVAPQIIMPDGAIYDSVKLLPTLQNKLGKLPQIFLDRDGGHSDFYPDFPFQHLRCVQTAISCCWFFRRDLLDRIGLFDEAIFYSPEDLDWCLRTWKAGRAVVYYPHLQVLHHTRQITHRYPFSRIALSHFKGIIYYLNKHDYWFSRQAIEQRYILPLANRLDPELSRWEGQRTPGLGSTPSHG